MKHIILEGQETEAVVLDVADLAAKLEQLPDPRDRRGKIYPLGMLLTLVILAKLAGEDKPSAITEWIRLRRDAFVKLFNCKHRRMPCLNIIRGVLTNISDEALERAFNHYLATTYGGQQSQLVVIDGKTMRGTIPKGSTRGVHLLAAYLPAEGVVLRQVEVGLKENEITAAPALVADIHLKHHVVCGDAMHTQRDLSATILGRGGNYVWFVKDNQPLLLSDVVQFFQPPQKAAGRPLPEMARTVAMSTTSRHGRLEQRILTLIVDEAGFLDWPGVRQVFRLQRRVQEMSTGVTRTEVVYGLTSYSPEEATADQLLAWTRQYWGIENGLHYRRDFTLREDATRISRPALARTIAVINNFVIGLVLKLGYRNLAAARRIFNARIAAQLPY